MGETYEEHLAEREGQNYASTRRWTPRPNVKGMLGERGMARQFGYEQDLTNRPGGDGGDRLLFLRTRDGNRWVLADAKCTSWDDKIMVNLGDVKPDTIYVCFRANADETDAECMGWIRTERLITYPTKAYHGPDSEGHVVPFNHLADMDVLLGMYLGKSKPAPKELRT